MFLSHLRQESFTYAGPLDWIYIGPLTITDGVGVGGARIVGKLNRPQQLLKEAQSRNPQWQVKRLSTPLEE